jgi:hypothetical protein
MAGPRLLTATFHATTYSTRKGFKFPAQLFRLFGFKTKPPSLVALTIMRSSGEIAFCGVSKFTTSGSEIIEANTCRNLGYQENIIVIASRAANPRT